MNLLASLPKGDTLAEPAWNSRHGGILSVLWLHVLSVPMFGIYMGASPSLYLGGGGLLAFIAVAARLSVVRRRLQSAIARDAPGFHNSWCEWLFSTFRQFILRKITQE